jgi:rod shape-determining protein MreC
VFQRRRARILLIVLLLAALVLVTVDVRTGDDGPLAGLRGAATSVLRPVQEGIATLVRPFGGAAGGIGELFSIRAENQELRAEVERLEQRRRSVLDLERELQELRDLIGLGDRLEFDTIGARVVALAPSSFEWTITIDVGTNDGVERDMPVIDGAGLVGRIIQTTPTASRVLLAIDPNFTAAARTARTGEIGTVDGRGGEPMLLRPLDPDADLRPGDEIVTSAYQGGVFPGGIPIGTVADVGDVSTRLTREVQVRPFVDFTRLHHVLVVTSAPVEEVPPLSDTQDFEFVPPPVPPTLDPDDAPDEDPDPEEGDTEQDGDAGTDDDLDGGTSEATGVGGRPVDVWAVRPW